MEATEKIPLWQKMIYGSGDLGFSLNNSIITAFFSVFAVTVVGIPPGLVAVIFMIGAAGISLTIRLSGISPTVPAQSGDAGDPSCCLALFPLGFLLFCCGSVLILTKPV
jgi:hypothetical protein